MPTAPGTRKSLDGISTGSEGEKQTVDVDVGIGNTEKLLKLCAGCSYESSIADAIVGFSFTSTVWSVVLKLSVPTEGKPNSEPIAAEILEARVSLVLPEAIVVGPLETTETELQKYSTL